MLELKVYDGSNEHYLELYINDPVNLKYQFTDIEEIQKASGSYSQSFRLPATDKNVQLFGTFFQSNTIEGFNPKRKKQAELYYQTIPILSGFIQLKSAYIQKENYADFEIVFFGEAVNLARTLGDKKLKDLDLSAYDHVVNYSNALMSWAGLLFSGDVRYGLIDKYNWSNNGNGVAITQTNPIYAGQMTLFLRLEKLLDQIAEDNGFTFESTWKGTLDNYYVPMMNGKQNILGASGQEDISFGVGLAVDQNVTLNLNTALSPLQYHPVSALSDTSPFFDNGGLFASNQYDAGEDGDLDMIIQATIENTTSGVIGASLAVVNVTDTEIVWSSSWNNIQGSDTQTLQYSASISVEQGKSYQFYIFHGATASGQLVLQGTNGGFDYLGTWWRMIDTNIYFGQTATLSTNAPDIKQIDFLTSLQKMFNLVFVPDKLDPTKIKIEPFDDFVSGGSIKDWTDYLDYSKDVVLEPTTDIQSKNYEWTYSKEKDFLNKFYEDNAKRVFGRYLIEDGENDFATGDKKVEPKFGAYPLNRIGGTDMLLHQSIDAQGQVIKDPLCKVVYWGGLQNGSGFIVYNDATSTPVVATSYPYFGHYSVPNPDVLDIDLNFGGEIPAYPIEANPYNNLFNTYWRNYVNQLYSTQARIMTAFFDLKSADIASFEYSDSIWIKDSYWRILSIDYSPNSNDLSKVKLIKVLDDVRACDQIPYQSNVGGLITFQNADGSTTITPSQTCCERFGYVYIGANCYQQFNEGFDDAKLIGFEAVSGGLKDSNLEGNVFANGSNIVAKSGSSGLVVGDSITIENLASNSLVHGEDIQLDSLRNVMIGGSNAYGFVEGSHRGAGWWYEKFKTGNKGAHQHGSIAFIYYGTFAKGSSIELFIEGKLNNRLELPNEVVMNCVFNVSLGLVNVATGRFDQQWSMMFFDSFRKSNSLAYNAYGLHANAPIHQAGDFSSNAIHMDIDTTTDAKQHRVELHNQNETLPRGSNVQILCTLNYTMVRL